MKSISRVEPLLLKDNKFIEVEDSDYSFIRTKVLSMQWAFYSKEFLQFQKDIEAVGLA
jgi:hypothetical protein